MNANTCPTQCCVGGIGFSDIQPKPVQKVLGNFFGKALQSALRMIHIALRMIHNALRMIQFLKQFMIYLYIYHKAT